MEIVFVAACAARVATGPVLTIASGADLTRAAAALAIVEAQAAQFVEECNDVRRLARTAVQKADTIDTARFLRRERQGHAERCRGAAKQRDELAAFQVIDWHQVPASQAQDIELAELSQRADCAERLLSRKSLANGGFGRQLRHDSSWIRLEIEASG